MYFLRRAHALYKFEPARTLSPSFWESEGKNADDRSGFDAIMPGIEHPLGLHRFFKFKYGFMHNTYLQRYTGRLLYTTGDVGGAVRFFLGLLNGSDDPPMSPRLIGEVDGDLKSLGTDKVFLEDFRVAFAVRAHPPLSRSAFRLTFSALAFQVYSSG